MGFRSRVEEALKGLKERLEEGESLAVQVLKEENEALRRLNRDLLDRLMSRSWESYREWGREEESLIVTARTEGPESDEDNIGSVVWRSSEDKG